MSISTKISWAACAATLGLGMAGAMAQSSTSQPTMTDVSPPPAEERNSTGAIVVDKSLLRPQRDRDFEASATRTGVLSVGRGVLRETMKAKAQADLAQAREEEAAELYRRGSSGLVKQ